MIMAALGPKARALVEAGRGALRPSNGDRVRVEEALRSRLGPGVLPPGGAAPPGGSVAPPPVAGAAVGWQVVAGGVLGVGLIGAVAYLAWPEPSPVPARAGVSTTAAPQAKPPPPTPVAPEIAAPVAETPITTPQRSQGVPPPRKRDRLAEEVALLSRATRALRAGRASEALQALAEHQRRFPGGALEQERRAARAQALCSLGRIAEGRAELSHLGPRSPAAARAKQACDSVSSADRAKPPER